jgi:hypothetical protein
MHFSNQQKKVERQRATCDETHSPNNLTDNFDLNHTTAAHRNVRFQFFDSQKVVRFFIGFDGLAAAQSPPISLLFRASSSEMMMKIK